MTAPALLRPSSAPLPAFCAVVESIPYAPAKTALQGEMTVSISDTGLIVYRASNPVAWIMPGYHRGQQDKQPKRCDFVDVSYFRQTQRGQNLEPADFLTLQEALQFIIDTFEGEI